MATQNWSRRQLLEIAFLLPAMACSKRTSPEVERGARFLADAVAANRMGLACHVNDTQVPAPVHEDGWLFSAHFIVAATRGQLPEETANAIAAQVESACRDGVWSYGGPAPVDADDTAFAARILRDLGRTTPAHDLSRFYSAPRSLYRTFASPGLDSIELELSTRGNLGIHPEVNLNIAELLGANAQPALDLAPVLDACVAPSGAVRSYFYPGNYYGAYWLVAAFRSGAAVPEALVERVAEFVASQQAASGGWDDDDPYASALAIATLRQSSRQHGARCEKGIEFLRLRQLEDGSWRSGAIMWQYEIVPGQIWNATDSNRTVTTALALSAISAASS